MLLTVEVSDWELEESGRVLAIGDRVQSWLTFQEADRRAPATEHVNVIRGVAVPLPPWPGTEFGRQPVRLDVEGGALYWDASEQVAGPIEVVGAISTNNVDAPEGFPETSGVVRRVRMMWDDFVMSPERVWRSTDERRRYEEVTSTYLPAHEATPFDPEVEAELRRMAREGYDGEMAAGRLTPEDSFPVGLRVLASNRTIPAGTAEPRWTGALIDLDTAATDKS